MADIFETRVLVAAINKIKPVLTPVLDLVFGRKKASPSPLLQWDVKSGSQTLLNSLKVTEGATVADGVGFKTVTCEAPRLAEKRLISAADLQAARAFGAQGEVELLTARVGTEQADIRSKTDLTLEFMAVSALKGKVVDGSGTVLVDYQFSNAQKPVLAGAEKWTDVASNPVKNIRAWKKRINQEAGGVSKFVALCGTDAMDALLNNQSVRELLKYTSGSDLATEGRVVNLAGVEILEVAGSYLDANGVRQDMVPASAFILVGLNPQGFVQVYAPAVELGEMNGTFQQYHSKSWEENDPSGRWVKGETRTLPVVLMPDLIVFATVV